jgi:hypothetical protein
LAASVFLGASNSQNVVSTFRFDALGALTHLLRSCVTAQAFCFASILPTPAEAFGWIDALG